MNEKPNFRDPWDMSKPPNPGLERYISNVYESNPDALQTKTELINLLEADPFDANTFRKKITEFEEGTKITKGYDGQQTTIETVRGKHGKLKVYHFQGSNSVMFGFGDLK